jgi:hypothetical protein
METYGVGLSLVACLALSACVIASPMTSETQPVPMSAVDTSWKVGKGFNLNEAKALIEFCTALDYGVDVPPDPPYAAVARPANAAGWEEIYPYHETLPANLAPQAIGPYGNAWKLYRMPGSDIYVIAIRGTIDTKGSIVADLIATSTPAHVQIQAKQNPYRLVSFTLADTPQAETHLGWTYATAELMSIGTTASCGRSMIRCWSNLGAASSSRATARALRLPRWSMPSCTMRSSIRPTNSDSETAALHSSPTSSPNPSRVTGSLRWTSPGLPDDGSMAQHHGPTYRTLIESPPDQGGLTPPSGLVASSSR